jgi:hypothetical protein
MFAKITPNPAASRRYFASLRKPADDNRAALCEAYADRPQLAKLGRTTIMVTEIESRL